ncbi:M20/M25/M40 family metallo-hydrolase [Aquihabitans sp. G128]|uniref:M20/M25/M40 family metallo-hydrolase n=1 Tax=Aquihabitans sp. G128 TaxID=2849779 RepID=UPI001C217293|nr:M20/M25/M40 family metallo-hydrolase [Aquihabitans sp. G128]QXC63358.1 M20/M25/M40 family metallo-hydrolase [Aquihabitans sp. G128]
MALDPIAAVEHTRRTWDEQIQPALEDYIRVPAVSVAFDPDWEDHGHLDAVVDAAAAWARERPIEGLSVEVVRLPGRTPLLWFEVPATAGVDPSATVLLYGHLDKQPPMTGWRDGLGPWEPVVVDDRLYGRGGADDGYAAYASLAAIEAVQAGGGRHARCVGLIECSEESGSPDLPSYVEHLAPRIGTPGLVVCLDSFCGDYERLWTTTSLRGLLGITLEVEVLTEGVHSGSASGVVPDTFRIARRLLDRVEDADTGRILVSELWADVPTGRVDEIAAVARDLGSALTSSYPFVDGARPTVPASEPAAQLAAKTWEPTLTVIGADGLPPVQTAGNVLRPSTTLSLSFRLPPTVDAATAGAAVVSALTGDVPQGARTTVVVESAESGWDAPATAPWLAEAMAAASEATFGQPARSLGEGGSIPFMGMLGERFPDAQFLLTGVLGPASNAHGPNEFLHLPTGRKVTATVALVLDAHAAQG